METEKAYDSPRGAGASTRTISIGGMNTGRQDLGDGEGHTFIFDVDRCRILFSSDKFIQVGAAIEEALGDPRQEICRVHRFLPMDKVRESLAISTSDVCV